MLNTLRNNKGKQKQNVPGLIKLYETKKFKKINNNNLNKIIRIMF